MRGPETHWKPPFEPMKALWLTLPGAAFVSIPAGMPVLSVLARRVSFLSSGGWAQPAFGFAGAAVCFLLLLIAPWFTFTAYRYCSRSEGHDGLRRLLAIFNLLVSILFAIIYAGAFIAFLASVFG